MTATTARTTVYKPRPMPRIFSRVLGKLLALPVEEGIEVSRAVWADAPSEKQRLMAMRMRIRVLHNAVETLKKAEPIPEPEPEVPENLIELTAISVPEPAPEPIPEPEIKVETKEKSGNLMSIDLESDMLSSMFAAMSSDDEDETP